MAKTGNALVTLKAETPAYGGLSIGRWKGKVVMIRAAIPGETVLARIDREKKDYIEATAVRVLSPSPDRVEPRSPYFGRCGGCQLQHISYERQVRMKEEVLRSCLRRIGGMGIALSEPLAGEPWHYRHRGRFKASKGRVGFFRERSRDVVDVGSCLLMAEEINEYYGKARELIRGMDVRELNISYGEGAVALIEAHPGAEADWDGLAAAFLDAGFAGIFIEPGGGPLLKFGRGYITLDLNGLKYTVSPMSFFQSNWELNRALVTLVIETLKPLEGRRVLDLYAGAGNFSLPLALHAQDVTAVEENPYAVEDGKRNLDINRIENCAFVNSGVDAIEALGPFDILVLDPPRTGLSKDAAERMLAMKPERIAYISCDPATLARDLKRLSAHYAVKSARLVDFFPQTYHVEALAFLRLGQNP